MAGRNVCVIDQKRDLASNILERVPESLGNVVVIDSFDPFPVGLNAIGQNPASTDRKYIEVSNLTMEELSHVQQIISDITKGRES